MQSCVRVSIACKACWQSPHADGCDVRHLPPVPCCRQPETQLTCAVYAYARKLASSGMTDKPDLVPFAKYDWNDALPDPADNLDVLLAKYARLRFVYEVNLRCDQIVCCASADEGRHRYCPECHLHPKMCAGKATATRQGCAKRRSATSLCWRISDLQTSIISLNSPARLYRQPGCSFCAAAACIPPSFSWPVPTDS